MCCPPPRKQDVPPVPAGPLATPYTPQELRYWGKRHPRKVYKYPRINKHARRGSPRHALLQMQQARGPKAQEMGNSRGERRNLRHSERFRETWSLQCDLPRQRAGPEIGNAVPGLRSRTAVATSQGQELLCKDRHDNENSEVMWRMNLSLTSS